MENTSAPNPAVPPSPPAPFESKPNASYGALISIVIILAIVIVGAFYSWGKRIEQNGPVIRLPEATTTESGA